MKLHALKIGSLFLSLAFVSTVSAADKATEKSAKSQAAPATVAQGPVIDIKKSEFTWKADKKIGSGHHGTINLKSAKAEMDKDVIKSAEFVMDMTSFTVTDLEGEWKEKFLTHVKSGDFFEVGSHPEAKLVIEKQLDKETVAGKLTIKEKTQPITVKFKQNKEGLYEGTLVFDRTKFGITYNSESVMSKVGADKIIKDEVKLDFKVALVSNMAKK